MSAAPPPSKKKVAPKVRKYALNPEIVTTCVQMAMPALASAQSVMPYPVVAMQYPPSVYAHLNYKKNDGEELSEYATTFDVVGAIMALHYYYACYWHPLTDGSDLVGALFGHYQACMEAAMRASEGGGGDGNDMRLPMFTASQSDITAELEDVYAKLKALNSLLVDALNDRVLSSETMSAVAIANNKKIPTRMRTQKCAPHVNRMWDEEVFTMINAPLSRKVLPNEERQRFYAHFLVAFNRYRHDCKKDILAAGKVKELSMDDLLRYVQHNDWFLAKMYELDHCCWLARHDPDALKSDDAIFEIMHLPLDTHHPLVTKVFVYGCKYASLERCIAVLTADDLESKKHAAVRARVLKHTEVVASARAVTDRYITDMFAAKAYARDIPAAAAALRHVEPPAERKVDLLPEEGWTVTVVEGSAAAAEMRVDSV